MDGSGCWAVVLRRGGRVAGGVRLHGILQHQPVTGGLHDPTLHGESPTVGPCQVSPEMSAQDANYGEQAMPTAGRPVTPSWCAARSSRMNLHS